MAKLFIGNLNFRTDEDDLKQFFHELGYIVSKVKIIMDRDTGKSRGFGFVEMDIEQQDNAIQDADGQTLDGRRLNVRIANDR